MAFYDVLDQVTALLKQRGRVSYRVFSVRFQLDDAVLEALKEERIEVHQLAVDRDDKMLVWVGETDTAEAPEKAPASTKRSPVNEPTQAASPR